MRTNYLRLAVTAALAVVLGIATFSSPSATAQQEAPRGRLLFVGTGCGGCHRIGDNDPAIEIGPSLVGLSERAGGRVGGLSAAAYIEQSIKTPQAFTVPGYEAGVMPTFPLTDDEVASLVEYLLAA